LAAQADPLCRIMIATKLIIMYGQCAVRAGVLCCETTV
jgi:hypothetical protein